MFETFTNIPKYSKSLYTILEYIEIFINVLKTFKKVLYHFRMSEIFENIRNISECVQYINVPNYSNKFCLIGIGRWNRKSKTRATSLILNLSGFISVTISGLNKKLPITLKKTLHQTQRGRMRRWREGKRRKRRKEWRWRKKEGDLLNPKSASVAVRCCHRCSVSEEQSRIQKKKK